MRAISTSLKVALAVIEHVVTAGSSNLAAAVLDPVLNMFAVRSSVRSVIDTEAIQSSSLI